jgi:hypothetical protein
MLDDKRVIGMRAAAEVFPRDAIQRPTPVALAIC